MQKASTITRKEMKAPDRFHRLFGQATQWASGRRKALIGGSIAVASLVLIATGASALVDWHQEKAGALLYKAFDAMDGEVSSVPLPGVEKPIFKTEQDRQKAVAAGAEEVLHQYPSGIAARSAALALGQAELSLGQNDKAVGSFESFLKTAPEDDSLRFAAHEGIAHAREAAGDLGKAADAYADMGRDSSTFKDYAALQRARLLGRAGQASEARKILEAFPETFKDSSLKTAAQEQLARLGAR